MMKAIIGFILRAALLGGFFVPAAAQTFPGLAPPNQVIAGPPSGATPGLPGPRSLVPADIAGALVSPPAIGGTTPGPGSFSSLTDTGISGSTQCLQTNSSGVLSGIGSGCPLLNGANTWSGTDTHIGDTLFGSGRPWIDVRSGANGCAAARGDNSTDDTSAFTCQLTYAGSLAGGGTVFVPCGNYHTTAKLTVPAGVFLVGQGQKCSLINTYFSPSFNNLSIAVELTGNYAGMNGIFVLGNTSGTATGVIAQIDSGAVGVQIQNSYLWGGVTALQASGVDCYVHNNFIGAASSLATAIAVYAHAGVCKYIGNKIDPPNSGATGTGIIIDNLSSGGTQVIENLFVGNDISGWGTNSVKIDDSADATARTAVTTFVGNIVGGTVNIHSAKLTSFSSGELGANITIGGAGGQVAVAGVMGTAAVTATGASCAANLNITC